MFNRGEYPIRNTIFIKLIVIFLIMMTPIFILGVYMYDWSVKTTREDISYTTSSQITAYLTDLKNEIDRMKLLQYGVLEDTHLNKLALISESMSTIEQTEAVNALLDRLYSIQNSSGLIQDVNAHIFSLSKTISSSRGAMELEYERYQAIHSAYQGTGAQMIEVQGQQILSAIKPVVRQGATPIFIIEIVLDSNQLQKSLHQMNTYPNSGTLLVTDSKSEILFAGTPEFPEHDPRALIRKTESGVAEVPVTLELGSERYYTARAHSPYLQLTVYRYIPESVILEPLNKFIIWAWLLLIAALAITVVYASFMYKWIHKPLLTLVKSFRRIEHGDVSFSIDHDSNDEFRYLYKRFNMMVSNLNSLINQVYKMKIMTQKSELKHLQSQINPHFLYNSFFILNTMAQTGDLERIEQFTTQLGEYFQFVTRNDRDEVPLHVEIHHARMYTEIQSLRFSRRIRVQFGDLPKQLETIQVPRLIVQPIIENAFEHSLEQKSADGLIMIAIEHDSSHVRIIVEDNGQCLTEEALHRIQRRLADRSEQQETTGMINIHRRLNITFGEDSGLEALRSEHGGLKVIIHIPKRREIEADVQTVDR